MGIVSFVNAKTLDDAKHALQQYKGQALIVAGGTNVMVDIHEKRINDVALINIREIDSMKGISFDGEKITIGALTTIAEIAKSEILREYAPAMYMAANVFADPAVRNSATIGGNFANASPAADMIPSLIAFDAEVVLAGDSGFRHISARNLLLNKGKLDKMPEEILVQFTFAAQKNSAFLKLGLRNAMAISIATCAASVSVDASGVVTACRIALGAVAPKTVRAEHAEAVVIGQKLDEQTIAAMMDAVQADICPIDDIRATASYRRKVVPVLMKRAVRRAAFGEC